METEEKVGSSPAGKASDSVSAGVFDVFELLVLVKFQMCKFWLY